MVSTVKSSRTALECALCFKSEHMFISFMDNTVVIPSGVGMDWYGELFFWHKPTCINARLSLWIFVVKVMLYCMSVLIYRKYCYLISRRLLKTLIISVQRRSAFISNSCWNAKDALSCKGSSWRRLCLFWTFILPWATVIDLAVIFRAFFVLLPEWPLRFYVPLALICLWVLIFPALSCEGEFFFYSSRRDAS